MRIELGCAAGDVESGDAPALQKFQRHVGDAAAHLLGAVRARSDMAMHAGLVAAIADVDLERVEPAAAKRREGNCFKTWQRFVHGGNLAEATLDVTPTRRNLP